MHTLLRAFALVVLPVMARAAPAVAQSDSLLLQGKRLLQEGINTNQVEPVLRARTLFVQAAADPRRAELAGYYAALADFRLISLYGFARDDRRRAMQHADAAILRLRELVERTPRDAEAHALLGAAYGQKIGLQPIHGMVLGPRSGSALSRARELAPDNPRVVLMEAIGAFNTPRMFGGSKARAQAGFERAVRLFAMRRATDPLQPDWGEDEAHAWLGIAHRDANRLDAARAAFESALRVNPRNGWVRHQLLPGVTR